jgi:diguanylate cyclase (GGDEF)-like protein
MRLDRRLARDITPFVATTLLGFALVPIGNRVDWAGYTLAAACMGATAFLVVFVPWGDLPQLGRVAPSLSFLVALALLRDASGNAAAGVGALALLPVFWMALHGSRGQLAAVIGGVCAFILRPAVLTGGPEYPLGSWRTAVVFGVASAVAGIAVQDLVARARSHARALALRERDLEAVADLSRSLSQTTDARQRICTAVCELSGARFAVLLEGQSDGTLVGTGGAGLQPPTQIFTPEGRASWAMTAYSSDTTLLISDPAGHAHSDPALTAATDNPAALLFEPVHRGEQVVGVLVAGWRQPPPDVRRTSGLIRLLATEAGFVIERADLLTRLTEIALTDELTGLPNRRAYDRYLEQTIRAAEPVCVALLDLDLFKSYNDDHGHQAGDLLLKEAAAAWRAELRSTDVLARYGGEEFVVLLLGDDVQAARRVVDRLRVATPREQSCSAGIARRGSGEDAATLLHRADEALYQAKRAGRNRSVIADSGLVDQRTS